MDTHAFFEAVGVAFEFAGVAALAVGFVVALAIALAVWVRTRNGADAFRTLREAFGGVILLGLELLVAADLVKTVTSSPTLTDAVVLGIIVLIRTILSFSLQVEIDGVAPWRRAFVTGPEVLAHAVKKAGAAGTPQP
ncbi:DUF1622 domain-containing protein [Leifsonia shinshuensis]|uniref:DUF1622 domain-containing protein n=1 Tax=Leifsonia shinshuensis TaxID=150026 RepID=A0A7G6Y8D7_9MICO|nr:DUF1622 domain-containing protein [Leifsonia shinshuensis]QNE34752.1 DUF1622 domain-containing protein [Leifsonia shinshuensis]